MSQRGESSQSSQPVSKIAVSGFKSIEKKQEIEIRPLTVLAGANSSGKSSMMQPVLLLKQTLESPSDPGSLLIRGPNVEFSEVKQLFSATTSDSKKPVFEIDLRIEGTEMRLQYAAQKRRGHLPLELIARLKVPIKAISHSISRSTAMSYSDNFAQTLIGSRLLPSSGSITGTCCVAAASSRRFSGRLSKPS